MLSRHTAATGTPFFPTLPASATTCLVPWGSTAHPTYPLPPYPPITQRRLAHLSFPLSHYPSLVQPPTLRNDVTWGFSTSHFPTSHAHGDTANDSERSSFLRSHHPTPQRTPTPWGLGTSERPITLPLRYPSRERVGYLPPSILPLLGTRACTASFSWDAPPSHFPSFQGKSDPGVPSRGAVGSAEKNSGHHMRASMTRQAVRQEHEKQSGGSRQQTGMPIDAGR